MFMTETTHQKSVCLARDARAHERTPLQKTIEEQVIPRLMLVHRGAMPADPTPAGGPGRIPAAELGQLAQLIMARDGDEAFAYVQRLRAAGMSLDALYLDLLAPTARMLGDLWTADLCDFTDVTVGLWRLQQMVHKLSPGVVDEGDGKVRQRRLLLVPEPGEQHTFGLIMVAECFRRDGWDVWDGPVASREELVSLVRREAFSVVGLSLGCESRLDAVAKTIRLVRKASRNPRVAVLVGGQPFIGHPERVVLVGADATAVDGQQAVFQANALHPPAAGLQS
jgi:methanogenic corrinoid protein MtbC1